MYPLSPIGAPNWLGLAYWAIWKLYISDRADHSHRCILIINRNRKVDVAASPLSIYTIVPMCSCQEQFLLWKLLTCQVLFNLNPPDFIWGEEIQNNLFINARTSCLPQLFNTTDCSEYFYLSSCYFEDSL